MIVKIIQTTDSGLVAGTVKALPDWVAKQLIENGVAEKYESTQKELVEELPIEKKSAVDESVNNERKNKSKKSQK